MARANKPSLALLDTKDVKLRALIGVVSDDELLELLVLKGGNALNLIHGIGQRTSLDLDFSMENDFPNLAVVSQRLEKNLDRSFKEIGLRVFDFSMKPAPPQITQDLAHFWGGYQVAFKLATQQNIDEFKNDPDALRRRAETFRAGGSSVFRIDISKHEYVSDKVFTTIDNFKVYVYSVEMIVAEKLRAICQQMPEYGSVVKRERAGAPRARDFIDIYNLLTEKSVDLDSESFKQLVRAVFQIKKVPLSLMQLIPDTKSFHAIDYVGVKATLPSQLQAIEFDYYFDFVVQQVSALKALWND